jgi:hypothetical protein
MMYIISSIIITTAAQDPLLSGPTFYPFIKAYALACAYSTKLKKFLSHSLNPSLIASIGF